MKKSQFKFLASHLFAATMAFTGLLMPLAAQAQYPAKPIRFIVPIPPGGAPDIIARVVSDKLSPLLGQPIVVETRAGSGGNIAMDLVARSAPDGYTVMICFDAMVVINPHMYSNMTIDPMKDLAPIQSLAVARSMLLVVNPSLPVKDFRDFIDYAKKASPPLSFASGGSGSQHQMSMELLKSRAGGHRGTASADLSRHPDHRRVLSGLPDHHVARYVRAGGPSRCDIGPAAHRNPTCAGLGGCERAHRHRQFAGRLQRHAR